MTKYFHMLHSQHDGHVFYCFNFDPCEHVWICVISCVHLAGWPSVLFSVQYYFLLESLSAKILLSSPISSAYHEHIEMIYTIFAHIDDLHDHVVSLLPWYS